MAEGSLGVGTVDQYQPLIGEIDPAAAQSMCITTPSCTQKGPLRLRGDQREARSLALQLSFFVISLNHVPK